MDQDDRPSSVAARIADGSAIDWAETASTVGPEDRALLDELRTIADVATLHRAPADSAGAAPATWGPLTILSTIGAGRFGEVFLAWDARLQRRVALKLLHVTSSALSSSTRAIEEARLLARVRHTNVLTVYGAECIDDQVGIWTEYIEGRTLETILTEGGPLRSDDVLAIGCDLCRALAAVHEAGLLHRDIKTQNVMRETGGRIVLMDFGTGHDLQRVPAREGDLSGTPLYLAPELFDGGTPSVSTDIYALAVLLFRLLTGQHPIAGKTLDDVRAAHLGGPAASLHDLRPDVPGPHADAIARGLGPNPAQRFRSAREFEEALSAARPPAQDAGPKPVKRMSRMMVGAIVVALALAGAGVVWWSGLRSVVSPTSSASPAMAVPSASPTPTVAEPVNVPAPPHAAEPPTDQLILPNLPDPTGSVTRDGRMLVEPDHDETGVLTGDLALRDLSTLRVTPLRLTSGPAAGVPSYPVFSRDGRQVAYRWTTQQGKSRLGVVAVRGTRGARPGFFVDDPEVDVAYIHDWKPDGTSVLVSLRGPGRTERLAWVATNDGSITPIKELEPGAMRTLARVSPDGTWIAYASQVRSAREMSWSIYLVTADGSREEALVTAAAANVNPTWALDGMALFYTSDRSGVTDLWSVPIRDGRAAGLETRVKRNIGDGAALGLAANGLFFYRKYGPGLEQIFVVPASGAPKPRPSESFVGFSPRWSPDGQSIAFLRHEQPNTVVVDLLRKTLRDHREAYLVRRFSNMPVFWLPDLTGLVGQVVGKGRLHPELNRVDLATASVTALDSDISPASQRLPAATALSHDGHTLYSVANGAEDTPFDRVIAIDLASGKARQIWQLPAELASNSPMNISAVGVAVSPDDLDLAIAIHLPDGYTRLLRVPVNGEGSRELCAPFRSASAADKLAWTTHGIYFAEAAATSESRHAVIRWRIRRISPDGGDAVSLFDVNGSDAAASFDPSPDGLRLAVHPDPSFAQPFSPEPGPHNELWMYRLAVPKASSLH